MAELKTKVTLENVTDFLNTIEDEQKRADAFEVARLMEECTGHKPKMWGESIVGFGTYHYVYSTGNSGDWPAVGFSPRKQNLTLYIMAGFDRYDELMAKLGKHKTGKSCLYLKRLSDVDTDVLRDLITLSYKYITSRTWP